MNKMSSHAYILKKRLRKPIEDKTIYLNIHEWGGYSGKRKKNIKNIPEFECGLYYQLKRFNREKERMPLRINVTISDVQRYRNLDEIEKNADHIDFVDNEGMDFSGYSFFYEKIKDQKNAYVILSNTSVNAVQDDFLENHIRYINEHPEVGMLGVSYCTRNFQSFVQNKFSPHLQSFYILTTIDVLREVVKLNGGFPGKGVDHKLLLIRKGEIKLSKLILKLKYDLAVVQEKGEVYQFGRNSLFDNAFNAWTLYLGDVRTVTQSPNRINPILDL